MKNISLDAKTDILISVFIAALVAANLLGSKITVLFGIAVSVGIFAYPITFLITDVIEEVHGKKKAQHLLWGGIITLALLFILTAVSRALPAADRYPNNQAYLTVFGSSLRIIIASLIAFALSQTHDIWAFNFWKKKTHGKFLWMRNNFSTVVSQFVDTTIFMFIAFYKIAPKFDTAFIFKLIIPYWIFKIIFAGLDTPLVYAGVRWLKGKKEE